MEPHSEIPRISQDPTDPAFAADPYPFYARLHAMRSPVFWEEFGVPVIVSWAAISGALRDRRLGRNDPRAEAEPGAFGRHAARSMLGRDGQAHLRVRAPVARYFSTARVRQAGSLAEEIADEGLRRLAPAGAGDLVSAFCLPTPMRVIARLIGADGVSPDDLWRWARALTEPYRMLPAPPGATSEANAATEESAAFFRGLLDARAKAPQRDLVSVLAAELDREEAIATLTLVLYAGHRGVAHTIAVAARALAGRPDLAEALSPERVADTVEEALRFDPPAHMFQRIALEDFEGFGLRLRKGDRVGVLLGAACRDPARFEEPGRFLIDRANPGHSAFGCGPHFCNGAAIARAEIAAVLPRLFARLPGLRITRPPEFANRYPFRAISRLDAAWEA